MKPNIDNYEEWLLDQMEGRLSPEREKELWKFLQKNPQCIPFHGSLMDYRLQPGTETLSQRHQLYRSELDLMQIPASDYWQIKQAEEGLSAAETSQLQNLLSSEANAETNPYFRIMLKAQPISYPNKNKLKKRVLPFWIRIATTAAALAILVALGILQTNKNNPSNNVSQIANAKTNSTENPKPHHTPLSKSQQLKGQGTPQTIPPPITVKQNTTPSGYNRSIPVANAMKPAMEKLLTGKNEIQLPNTSINAFEAGLNHMMPVYVALLQQNDQPQKAQQKTIHLDLLGAGLKIYNAMSGREISLRREFGESGEVVAYNLQSESFIVNRQIQR